MIERVEPAVVNISVTRKVGGVVNEQYAGPDPRSFEGTPFEERLRLATAYATLSVRAQTARAGATDRNELTEFLERTNPQAGRRP